MLMLNMSDGIFHIGREGTEDLQDMSTITYCNRKCTDKRWADFDRLPKMQDHEIVCHICKKNRDREVQNEVGKLGKPVNLAKSAERIDKVSKRDKKRNKNGYV